MQTPNGIRILNCILTQKVSSFIVARFNFYCFKEHILQSKTGLAGNGAAKLTNINNLACLCAGHISLGAEGPQGDALISPDTAPGLIGCKTNK